MENLKKYGKNILITFGLILGFSLILNIMNYFDLLGTNLYKVLLMAFVIISIIPTSFMMGKTSKDKGYLTGIKFGTIIVFLFLFMSVIMDKQLSLASFIYYLVIVITSSLGSMIGINKKQGEE